MTCRLKFIMLALFSSILSVNFTASTIRGFFKKPFQFDKNGIPVYEGRYNPVLISQYAMEEADNETLIKIADWISRNIKDRGGFGVLEYDFYFPVYRLEPPWISALANAEAMGVLIDAYEISDGRYLDDARFLLRSFCISIDSGGVTLKEAPDRWWYAEYVREDPPMVLNGMMITLLRIREFYEHTGDSLALSLFIKGLKSLCYHLSEYDFHGLTRYDLTGRIAGFEYHKLHIKLINDLYNLTGCEKLKRVKSRWSRGNVFVYRLFVYPNIKDLFVLVLNFLFFLFVFQLSSKFFKK